MSIHDNQTRSSVQFPEGTSVPSIGQGTYRMGDDPAARATEIATLRTGLDLGLTVIDTAEMYGSGRSEQLVGEAIAGRRDDVFLVDKVLPSNASRLGTIAACERSLRALNTSYIDLYLLHWRSSHPLHATVEAFEELMERGLIRTWGVSNFDPEDLRELPQGWQTDQVLYNPSRRGIEFDLLPALAREHKPAMAYSPIEEGRLLTHPSVSLVAERHSASPAQVLLAWAIRSGNVLAIPKASHPDRVTQNAAALQLRLTAEDITTIDAAFPPPTRAVPLEVI